MLRLQDYERLLRRRRLWVSGPVVLEEKLDGALLVAYEGRIYTGAGRRAPGWMVRALEETGADPWGAVGLLLYIELYGRCLTPGGYHRGDPECYRAALVDAARPPASAGVLWEAVLQARVLEPWERLAAAEEAGMESPRAVALYAERPPEPGEMLRWLDMFPGREGYVMKLYAVHGHRLPPEHGAKLRGVLEVKVRQANRGSRLQA